MRLVNGNGDIPPFYNPEDFDDFAEAWEEFYDALVEELQVAKIVEWMNKILVRWCSG